MYSCTPMRLSSGSNYAPSTMDQGERRINSELWHACAGPLVSLPPVGSQVVYFPQGHTEQVAASTQKEADARIPNYPNLPPRLICSLDNVTLHADTETDEVYAQMVLIPTQDPEKETMLLPDVPARNMQPTDYFCKTLTASDTSTHGGFSIPRRAAEKVFPALDYTQTPPAQELVARDLHDQDWHFRHIYRGQPRRHLLTTGWSVFVSAKRLLAGDAVLFIRNDKGQLLLGIRRANRQQTIMPSSVLSSDSMHIGILAAASHAAATNSRFTIFYNPRQSPSEFVVPLPKYQKAVFSTQVTVGLRFRMVVETEESSVRRHMGTITGIGDLDPVRWPKSQWRSLKVGWDESTAGERPRRVSLWEIEPLTTPFLLCPPPLAMRPKRARGMHGEDEDIETFMKKSQLWYNSSDSLGSLNFGIDPSWMRVPQQRPGLSVSPSQNEYYRTLAAAALQEFRSGDASKPLVAESLPNSQILYRQQAAQTQQQSQHSQQLMPQMNDIPGPLLQLSTTQTQGSIDMGSTIRSTSSYPEAELHMSPSPRAFSLQGMMGRVQGNGAVTSADGNQFSNMMRANQNGLPPCNQVASSWFSTLQNQSQAESQSAASPRLNRMESSNGGGIPGSYALHQHGEAGVQQGLENLPTYGFRNNGPDSDQLQADRSHLLFGVSIDPSLGTSSVLPSPDYEKAKDAAGNNMLPGTFCPSATPVDSGNLTSEGLDENVLMQRNLTWPVVQTAHPVRSFTKVHRLGSVGRSLDVRNFPNYTELRKELARMFHLDCLMEDPEQSGWQIVFVDNENDTLLLGDDPWEEFLSCVRSIKILSPVEVAQMSQDFLKSVAGQQKLSNSNSEDAHTQSSPLNPQAGGGGTLDQ